MENGNNTFLPLIRFKGFTNTWELRKLSDLVEGFNYGLNASAIKYDGIHKYIRITDIDDESHLFVENDLKTPKASKIKAENYKLRKGDILFARTGASVGKTYKYDINDGNLYFAGFLIRAKVNSLNDLDFIFQNTLTDNYNKFISLVSQRSGQPGVNAREYQDYTFMVPSLNEQSKIGSILKNVDYIIALHQHECFIVFRLSRLKISLLNQHLCFLILE